MADDTNPFAKYVADTEENPFAKYAPEGTLVSVPPQPLPGVLSKEQAEDIVKSAGTGLAHGAAGIAGMQGDVEGLIDQAVRWAGNKAGLPEPPATRPSMASRIAPPTSSDMLGAIDTATGGLHKPASTAGRFAESVGEFTPAALLAGPQAGLGASLFKYAVAPGLASEAAGQATQGTPAEPWARLAAAVGTPGVAGRVATPFAVSPENQAARAALRGEGITPTAGQVTGGVRNNWLKYWEGDLAQGLNEQQAQDFTRAASHRVGMDEPRITRGQGGVFDRMYTDVGNTYNGLTARNNLVADPQLAADLAQTHQTYNGIPGLYPDTTRNAVTGAIQRIGNTLTATHGTLTGAQYQAMRSQLRDAAMGSDDPQRAAALHAIVNHLDDNMERSIAANNPADSGAFADARRQYRNFLVIERALSGNAPESGRGYLTPQNLATAAKAVYGDRAFLRGQDDFSDLINPALEVLHKLPDSGTSQRNRINETIRGLSGLGGAALGGEAGGNEGAVLGLLRGEAAGQVFSPLFEPLVRAGMRGVLMSPLAQRYLQNTVVPRTAMSDPRNVTLTAQALMKGARGAGYLPVPNSDQRAAQ